MLKKIKTAIIIPKTKKTNEKSNLSNARSELISNDELERSVFYPGVANMKGIKILEPKNITQTSLNYLEPNGTRTSFEYLRNNTEVFFLVGSFPNIFDSDLKDFFNYIAFEEIKNIDYMLLSKQILILSKNIFSFLDKYGDLYNF